MIQFVCVVGDIHWTVLQGYIVDAMVSEDSQPGAEPGLTRVESISRFM